MTEVTQAVAATGARAAEHAAEHEAEHEMARVEETRTAALAWPDDASAGALWRTDAAAAARQ